MDKDKLKAEIVKAEQGDKESIAVVREVLRPKKEDSIEMIKDKLRIFIRLIYLESLKFKDAPHHVEIDETYAEQISSILKTGKPKYKGLVIVGYRESAKTSRVKMCESYLTCYLPEYVDLISVVSEDGGNSNQFNMDMFNTLAFSRIDRYFPNTISFENKKKKESQTMSKFTTSTGVTYSSSSARKTKRGNIKTDIDDDMSVEMKRPKKIIFDDIENEVTIESFAVTEHIRKVMDSTIDGLDQISGSWILLGNYLSLRGNVHRFITKFRDSSDVKIILIPILDGIGQPTWADKYVLTDNDLLELQDKGIHNKVSIESLKRKSENFELEFMNNPSRSSTYFDDRAIISITKNEDNLISDEYRNEDGLLILEESENTGTYIMGLDGAKGVGKDQSAFTIWKTDGLRYQEVANFKSNKIRPEKFAPYSVNIAKTYNNALIIPENNYPGNEVIAFMLPIYTNIFVSEVRTDSQGNKEYTYGVNTNMKTKGEMFLHTKRLLLQDLVLVRSKSLYNQILEYPEKDITTIKQDSDGGHFDLLMSAVIGLWKAGSIAKEEKKEDNIDNAISRIVDDIYIEHEEIR